MNTITITVAIVALIVGYFIAKILEKKKASSTLKTVNKQSETIIKEAKIEAEGIKKDKILQAKEKFIELKAEHEKVILSRDKKINEAEKRIRDKESRVSQELDKAKKSNRALDEKNKQIGYRLEQIEKKNTEIEKLHKRQVEQLETLSGLSADEAKKELVLENLGSFNVKALLMGSTSKKKVGDEESKFLGQFGEGMKLAMLVLLKSGRGIIIESGNMLYYPTLKDW